MISARCVARDLHTVAPRPLERTCWRLSAAEWGDCKQFWIAPLNAIIIIFIIIILMIEWDYYDDDDDDFRDWRRRHHQRTCQEASPTVHVSRQTPWAASVPVTSWNSCLTAAPPTCLPSVSFIIWRWVIIAPFRSLEESYFNFLFSLIPLWRHETTVWQQGPGHVCLPCPLYSGGEW